MGKQCRKRGSANPDLAKALFGGAPNDFSALQDDDDSHVTNEFDEGSRYDQRVGGRSTTSCVATSAAASLGPGVAVLRRSEPVKARSRDGVSASMCAAERASRYDEVRQQIFEQNSVGSTAPQHSVVHRSSDEPFPEVRRAQAQPSGRTVLLRKDRHSSTQVDDEEFRR